MSTRSGGTAVVAVHGVGSPAEGATAWSLARLLQQTELDARYSEFSEIELSIPVRPLEVGERRSFDVGWWADAGRTRFTRRADEPSGIAFMRKQLECYDGAVAPYETIELRSRRTTEGEVSDVSIFEMNWADLSRLGRGPLRLLGAIYQLVLHFSHLGRKTLDIAAAEMQSSDDERVRDRWARFARLHAFVVRLFTLISPVVGLVMLAGLPFVVAAGLPARVRAGTALVLSTLLLLAALAWAVLRRAGGRTAAWVLALAGVALVVAARLGWPLLPLVPVDVSDGVLMAALGLTLVAAYAAALVKFAESQPGAEPIGAGLAVLLVSLVLFTAEREAAQGLAWHAARWGLDWVQWGFVFLMATWALLWLLVFVSFALSALVNGVTRGAAAVERWRRVRWTARVSLIGASVAFVLGMTITYSAALHVIGGERAWIDLLPGDPIRPVLAFLGEPAIPYEFLHQLIVSGGGAALPMMVIMVALLAGSMWWFVVVIIVSLARGRKTTPAGAQRLGEWISAGLGQLAVMGTLLTSGMLAIVAIALMARFLGTENVMGVAMRGVIGRDGEVWVTAVGYAVVSVGATVLGLRIVLDLVSKRIRPAVGIMLDVDHYLRESPEHGTPRARMAERFTSVLRHIAEAKDAAGGHRFDRIVIAAHSQGTVLSVDLLRFLQRGGVDVPWRRPGLQWHLLTFGSPLRQLYARHFPDLYDFVEDDAAMATGAASRCPDPAELGVARWTNVFYSGDYIGRALWRPVGREASWVRDEGSAPPAVTGARERCLGWGSHTHYWTSGDVAEELDRLVG